MPKSSYYTSKEFEVKAYKRMAKRIAKDLRYSPLVIERIDNAETSTQISNIMRSARMEGEV